MDAQIKKGAIEMCVLHVLNNEDSYGYDITEKIARFIDVGEGTIYPVLRRLSDYDFVESYLKDKGYEINDIDGVRAEFDNGWALVRASNTGPNITARFEGVTEADMEKIKEEFMSLLNV